MPWVVDLDALRSEVPIPRAHLLNDLEALAWSVPVLMPDEIEVLHEGQADARGNVALIAAGTGLGIALLPNIDGRLVPRASEGGHVDFAPRNADEQSLAVALRAEYGRVDIERVVSGPGLANIHRILHPHQCATLTPMPSQTNCPRRSRERPLEAGCPSCTRTLECFVSAYGASAGNLALTVLATGRSVSRRRDRAAHPRRRCAGPIFMRVVPRQVADGCADLARPGEGDPEPGAGLLGAASYANLSSRRSTVIRICAIERSSVEMLR